MIDARNYIAFDVLKDGTPITVRAIRPADRNGVLDAFQRLDRGSVYTRFFVHKATLTDTELHQITEVDFDRIVALVATTRIGGEERLIGGGRYISDVAGGCAELAFITADNFRGRGIAGLLLRHLIQIGREHGVSQFEADVLAQNQAMLAVFHHSGLVMRVQPEGSTVHVTLSFDGMQRTVR